MSGYGLSVPLGMNTPIGESEWNTFLRRRAELLDAGMQRLGLAGQVAQASGAPPLAAFQATSLITLPQEDTQRQMLQMPVTDDEYRRLLGAADFYEIDNPGTLDPNQLRQMIEERRQYLISRRMEEDPSIAGELYDTVSTFLGTTGLGMVDAVVGASQRIPFLGDAIRKSESVQNYRRGLAMLEEGFTGDMVDNERAAYERLARPLQHFLGYSAMVGVAAEAVGATGFAGGVANPLIRGSLQGGATGWLLEGGGDDPISHRAMKIGLFAGTQGAMEWGLPKIAARLRGAFRRPSDPTFNPEPIPISQRPPTMDAEWAFVDDATEAGTRLIAPPSRQIGPGTAPITTGPVGPLQTGPRPLDANMALQGGTMRPGTFIAGPGITQFPVGQALPATTGVISSTPSRLASVPFAESVLARPIDELTTLSAEVSSRELLAWRQAYGARAEEAMRLQNTYLNAQSNEVALQARAQLDTLSRGVPQDALLHLEEVLESGLTTEVAQTIESAARLYHPSNLAEMPTEALGQRFVAEVIGGNPANRLDTLVGLRELSNELNRRGVKLGDLDGYTTQFALQRGERLEDVKEVVRYYLEKLPRRQLRLDVQGAGIDAVAATKQGTILESPSLPTLAKQPEIQDADVAVAALASNPGQVSIIQGVGDTAKTIRRFLQDLMPNGVGPQDFRAVQRGGRVDILVADGRAITNKMAKEYETFGMFRGQQASTSGGQQVVIEDLGAEFSRVRTVGSGVESTVPTRELMPGKASAIADAAPEAYAQLRAYAQSRMADEAVRSGLNPMKVADWFSDELATQLPRYIDEFLDLQSIQGLGARGAYTASFTEARMADFRTLAPEEFALADELATEVNQATVSQAVQSSRPVYIEEIAETKGMAWVPAEREMGGTLVDLATGEEVAVESLEAGFQFLQSFNRTPPDYSPFTTVPVELAASAAGSANPGSSLGPRHYNDVPELVDDAMRNMDRLERMFTGGGGSGRPPSLPPGMGGPVGGGGFLPPGSLPEETLGAQFERLRTTQSRTYDEVMNRFDSLALRILEPMRNFALNVEQNLHSVGVTKGTYWQHYSDVVNGRAVAHNEAVPWHREINNALGLIRRRFIRDGTVTLIGEMRPEVQAAAMENAGYTAREIQGQLRIREILDGLREQYEVRQLMDYMPHLRSRAARGEDFGTDLDAMFGGTGRFFADLVRSGSIDVREMNAGLLLHRWVRAATHHRHVQPAIDEMAQAWVHDPRVPDSFRQLTNDWLELVAHGHTPGQDVVIPGVRHALNALKIPVTNGEVARGVNWIFTNMYRGALGMRPDVVVRDLLGPMFGGTRVGFAPIGRSYAQFFRGGAQREEMVQLALRGGWMERGMVPMGASEMFQSGLGMVPGVEAAPTTFAPWQEAVREGAARVGDVLRDALPTSMRSGIQGSVADPLHWYTKEGEFNRLISGHAGYSAMNEALQPFIARVGTPDFDLRQATAQVLLQSGAANYGAPIQRRIAGFLAEGRYEEAAFTFANEVANSQFRYGTAEQSLVVRQSGVVGRFGSTFGTFTQQYVAQMKEGMTAGLAPEFGGTSVHRSRSAAAFLARHSAIAGALGLATAYTGWNFGKWFWHGSLGWGGGPMLISMMTKMQELTGRYNQAQGEPLSPMQTWAVQQSEYSNQPGFVERLNPYAGGMRTLEGLGQTFSSANPLEGTAEFLITGKRNAGDMVRQFNDAPYQVGPPQPWAPTPDWAQGQVPPQQTLWIGGGGATQ